MQVDTNIQNRLTPDEQEVLSIIREVISKYSPSTKAYVAGGWVRDKLMGVESNDIDIMLDRISGEDFARLIAKHKNLNDPHIIRENPEKSKHVETAKMYIPLSSGTEQELDLVQARQEVYTEDSRIPSEVKPATPEEDAFRRDATINSIFYDILDNKVVDFTGQGIPDLISNTIRAPGNPLDRFLEDPLRVLRVIRFASKYDFEIEPKTFEAMMDPALRQKIVQKDIPKSLAKERVGEEITKMLKNPNPQYALELLKETGIWEDFIKESLKGTQYEGEMEQLDMEQNNPHHKLTVWGHTMEVVKNVLDMYSDADPEKRITMVLAALMHDIGKLFKQIHSPSKSFPGQTSYIGHELESKELTDHILRYIKMEPYIDQVAKLAQHHMRPHRFTEGEETSARAMRKFVRQMGEQSLNWLDVFNLAVADAYSKDVIPDPTTIQQYQNLEQSLKDAMSSLRPIETKITPVLNGNEIMNILGIKPGSWMSEITEFVKDLRDENPDISKEEASQQIQSQYGTTLPPNAYKVPPVQSVKPVEPIEAQCEKCENKEKKEKKKPADTCPKHLFQQRKKDVWQSQQQGKDYEVFTILKHLQEDYGNDEDVLRYVVVNIFPLLIKDEKYRNDGMLQFIFTKAEHNFFDTILCSFVFGILILLKTNTKDNVITEIGDRMLHMAPGTMRTVLEALPDKVDRPHIKKKFEKSLKNEDL